MCSNGYIKLSRKFFDNKIWQAARAFSECEAWIDLIQSARFEASPTTSRIGCYEVTWERGQYPASNRFLAKKWGRSEQWVKSFLGKLKREKMITTDNSQGVNIISLVNFDKYNGEEAGNPPNNPPRNPPNDLRISELQDFVTHLVTQQVTHLQKLAKNSNSLNGLKDSELQENLTHPKTESNPPNNPPNEVKNSELQEVVTHPTTHLQNLQPTSNPNNKKDKENNKKETLSLERAKKDAALAATLSRKEDFYQSLIPFIGKYPKDMIQKFFNYWSEMNRSCSKMRFEQQPTWETAKRLATWAARDRSPSRTGIGVILTDNSTDKYDSPQEKKWEERWSK